MFVGGGQRRWGDGCAHGTLGGCCRRSLLDVRRILWARSVRIGACALCTLYIYIYKSSSASQIILVYRINYCPSHLLQLLLAINFSTPLSALSLSLFWSIRLSSAFSLMSINPGDTTAFTSVTAARSLYVLIPLLPQHQRQAKPFHASF